jgi:predicted chitinase
MNFASSLRSTGIALGLLAAAVISCTNGSLGDNGEVGAAAGPSSSGGASAAQAGGTSASGAPTSTAGTSATGNPACPGAATYLITDLETMSQWNAWQLTNDATPGGTQTPMGAFAPEISNADLHYSAHTTGNGFTNWGAGLVLNLASARKCYDLSKFTGFKFSAKGPARGLIVAAQVPGVLPTTSGGTCATNCFDSHKTSVVLTSDFADYTLYWGQFQQAGWGTPVVFQGTDVQVFDFEVGPADMPFDFWIDNISFIDTPPPTMTGGGGATGAGGATGVAGSPTTGGGGTGTVAPPRDFSTVLTEDQFNGMFPNRDPFYTYAGLVAAATKYNIFAAVGTPDVQKQEVAAFLANVAHETTSLKYVREQAQDVYCDSTNAQYKCAAGQEYYGRGPLQISWNYNYGACGAALGQNLLANPDLVATDPTVSWEAALWFWMTAAPAGRTAHSIMALSLGFGQTINVINGSVECGGKDPNSVNDRVNFYKDFCSRLGVDPGTNLTC